MITNYSTEHEVFTKCIIYPHIKLGSEECKNCSYFESHNQDKNQVECYPHTKEY